MVLEYAEGGSLKTQLAKAGPMDEQQAAQNTVQILRGLGYLHQ